MPVAIEGGRPSRSALFIEQDTGYDLVCRNLKHSCTIDEWIVPSHRAAKIAECWRLGVDGLRSEKLRLVTPAPVTLYRHPITGDVIVADICGPHESRPVWIDSLGNPAKRPRGSYVRDRTTYMHWAEGPLVYMGDTPTQGPNPLDDRYIQYLRHQNSMLREIIDASLVASADEIPRDAGGTGLVDFRVRGWFLRPSLRVFQSKQTHANTSVVLDGIKVDVDQLGT